MGFKISPSIASSFIIATVISLLNDTSLFAAEVKIAVASNFTAAIKEIASDFEKNSGHKTIISFGSTGKLYTQILYNAPFDILLSADQQRPQLLETEQRASERFTYAIGKLVLWSSDANKELSESTLKRNNFRKLALANPKTAPYGIAAISVLKNLGLANSVKSRLVFGDNIAQAYQFVATGNAQLGFVALAQTSLNNVGKHWEIPQSLYEPIRQDAILLRRGIDNPAAKAFLDYLKSDVAKITIQKFDYAVETSTRASNQLALE